VTLSAISFNYSGNDGVTYTLPSPAINANVQTNDANGYQLLSVMGSNGFAAGAAQIPNSAITPLVYPGGPNTTPAFNPTTDNFGNSFQQVVGYTSQYSANGGDNYNVQWQFAIPGNQPAGVYNGTIIELALGN
jgi:hypothetical protein